MTLRLHPDPREPGQRAGAHGAARSSWLTWRGLAGLVLLGGMVAAPMVLVVHASWTTAVLVGGGVLGVVRVAAMTARGGRPRPGPACKVCGRAVDGVEPLRADSSAKRCPECGGAMG